MQYYQPCICNNIKTIRIVVKSLRSQTVELPTEVEYLSTAGPWTGTGTRQILTGPKISYQEKYFISSNCWIKVTAMI